MSVALHILAAILWVLALNAATGFGMWQDHPAKQGVAMASFYTAWALGLIAFALQVIA